MNVRMLTRHFPILILPGWMMDAAHYTVCANEFKNLRYETYTVSFPGFPNGPSIEKAYGLTDYVIYLDKYLKKHQIKKGIFICHSFGGRVALKYLSQNPDKAYALILSGTPGFPSQRLYTILIIGLTKLGNIVSYIPPILFFRNTLKRLIYKRLGSKDYYFSQGLMKETFIRIVNESLIDYMRKIRLPTLLLWGEKDNMVKVTVAKRMREAIKNVSLIIIPGGNHSLLINQPKRFVQEVVGYLDKLT